MAITKVYSGDPLLMAEVARMAGQGQFAQAQDQFRAGQDQFHLNLGQRAREFDESTRQFDTTHKEGVRRFDQTYDLNRDQFGEQQRQADIANQRSDFQFGSKLDFDYDQMAQQQYAREQEMAFQAQQQQERQNAAMAAQQQQQQHSRWQTYQGIESQQFAVHAKQAEAELKKLGEHKFRTPELKEAAYAQWQERYGSYMPAPIDFGPPPEQQDPWDTVPQREIQLPDGSTVTGYLTQDRNGNWSVDTSVADLQARVNENKADNDRATLKVDLDRQQGEQTLTFNREKFAQERERAAFDGRVKEYQGLLDGFNSAQDARDSTRQMLMRQAEREAGKNPATQNPNPVTPERLQAIEAEVSKIPLPPMPKWEEVVDAPQVGTAAAPEAASQQSAIPVDPATGLPAPQYPQQVSMLPPGTQFLAPDGSVRIKP